jgi:hypothetical protein
MMNGEHYVASNFLFGTYYIQIVQIEDMIESTDMLRGKQIMCTDFVYIPTPKWDVGCWRMWGSKGHYVVSEVHALLLCVCH